MASSLKSLIRLRKWELDEARRALAEILEQRDMLEAKIEAIDDEMQEQSKNSGLEVFATTLGTYIEAARNQQKELYGQIAKKDEIIEKKQEIVSERFQELKTFEIALDQQEKKAAAKLAKQDQDILDEQGLQTFDRNKQSENS